MSESHKFKENNSIRIRHRYYNITFDIKRQSIQNIISYRMTHASNSLNNSMYSILSILICNSLLGNEDSQSRGAMYSLCYPHTLLKKKTPFPNRSHPVLADLLSQIWCESDLFELMENYDGL